MKKRPSIAVAIDIGFALPHHIGIYAGIHRFAFAQDWDYVLDPHLIAGRLVRGSHPYDGVIGRITRGIADRAAEAGIPVVNVWAGSPVESIPTVMPDYRAAGRMAAEHLLARGYRNFACHGIKGNRGLRQATEGFVDTVREAGYPCTSMEFAVASNERPQSWDRYATGLDDWIRTWRPPLGAFVVQDIRGRYLANACRRLGLRIPEDVGMVSNGNALVLCSQPEPSLSSIDPGYERVGFEAAALLDGLLHGGSPPTAPVVFPPRGIVIRRSTDLSLVDDEVVAEALRFISEHSHESIRVEQVAEHTCSTVRSLERHFKKVMQRTIKEEITRMRLERAKRILLEVPQPLKQVARASGFSSAAYLHQVFMKAEGITPVEFRRLHRGP